MRIWPLGSRSPLPASIETSGTTASVRLTGMLYVAGNFEPFVTMTVKTYGSSKVGYMLLNVSALNSIAATFGSVNCAPSFVRQASENLPFRMLQDHVKNKSASVLPSKSGSVDPPLSRTSAREVDALFELPP